MKDWLDFSRAVETKAMLRIAIAGCGKISDAHAWAIQSIGEECEIVGACDVELLMAKQFSERFQVKRFFDSVEEMLEETRPDVVHVTTPPQTHYSIARQCLEHRCHVYVEKPFTLCATEAEELLMLATREGLSVTVGRDEQFSHVARRMRGLVRSGYLGGRPVHIESTWCYDLGGDAYANALLRDKKHWVRTLPGRLLHNLISHGVAKIAEFLAGDHPRVIAHGFVSPMLRKAGEEEIVDELRVIIRDEQDTTAYFTFSAQMRPSLHEFRLFGPKNGLFFDEDRQILIKLRGKRYTSYLENFIPPLALAGQYLGNLLHNARLFLAGDFHVESGKKYLIQSFYRSIIENAQVPIPYREILLTLRIMDQIFDQIAPGRTFLNRSNLRPKSADARALLNRTSGKGLLLSLNADDWGRSRDETDAAAACYSAGRINSVSAMVFMEDSERAAELAKKNDLNVGLHLNLSESFTGNGVSEEISKNHARVARFINWHKYSLVLYNPFLRRQFYHDFQAQLREFLRLYGKPPSHFDGHMHHHLCSNMLLDQVIPAGQRVRRCFSFSRGEKAFLNVVYRNLVNRWLKRRYEVADYFFSLDSCLQNNQLAHVVRLAKEAKVELMAHPTNTCEYDFLMGEHFDTVFDGIERAGCLQP